MDIENRSIVEKKPPLQIKFKIQHLRNLTMLKPLSLGTVERNAVCILKEIGIDRLVQCDAGAGSGQWVCPWKACATLWPKLSSLKEHFMTDHNTRPYNCDIDDCVWTFANRAKLERHKRAHSDAKLFKCDFAGCEKAFKTFSNLTHHKKEVHVHRQFTCPIASCGASFHKKSTLNKHMPQHEEAKPEYSCAVESCGKSFFTYNALCSHKKVHQYKKSDLQCKLCNKIFKVPCRLRTHMNDHENDHPYRCTQPGCPWTFPSQSKLDRHLDKHFQIRRFACTFTGCSKAFLRQQHLTDHTKTHVLVIDAPDQSDQRAMVQVHNKPKSKSPAAGKRRGPATAPPASSSCVPKVSATKKKEGGYLGSARTCITYGDVVEGKSKSGQVVGKIALPSPQSPLKRAAQGNASAPSPVGPPHPTDYSHLNGDLGPNHLETGDLLQSDPPGAVQQDLMLSGASLTDTSINLQDEHLTQEYFLLLESSSRLSDFEPSTINLRDLE